MNCKIIDSSMVRKREMFMLLDLFNFCKKNKLKCYLAGGTLLGAIRHQGFIPWDDDIDVCLPRRDYERLIKEFHSEKYNLLSFENDTLSAPFAKIVDLKTRVISKYNNNEINNHLWVDVLPVDGLPSDYKEIGNIYKRCDVYRKIYSICNARLGGGTSQLRKYMKYILKPILRIYGSERCAKKIKDISQTVPYDEAENVGIVTWGLYGMGECMNKEDFEKSVEVTFEGYRFSTFSCWDSYLHNLYGDYMQIPPKNKRRTHSMEVYVDE